MSDLFMQTAGTAAICDCYEDLAARELVSQGELVWRELVSRVLVSRTRKRSSNETRGMCLSAPSIDQCKLKTRIANLKKEVP